MIYCSRITHSAACLHATVYYPQCRMSARHCILMLLYFPLFQEVSDVFGIAGLLFYDLQYTEVEKGWVVQ